MQTMTSEIPLKQQKLATMQAIDDPSHQEIAEFKSEDRGKLTARGALHTGLCICWPHNEIPTGIDDHPVPGPLEKEDHLAAARHNVLYFHCSFRNWAAAHGPNAQPSCRPLRCGWDDNQMRLPTRLIIAQVFDVHGMGSLQMVFQTCCWWAKWWRT